MLCCVLRTVPVPLQYVHILMDEASLAPLPLQVEHGSSLLSLIGLVAPLYASSNDRFILTWISSPCLGAFGVLLALPPPKKDAHFVNLLCVFRIPDSCYCMNVRVHSMRCHTAKQVDLIRIRDRYEQIRLPDSCLLQYLH